jgi:hypothetical protein
VAEWSGPATERDGLEMEHHASINGRAHAPVMSVIFRTPWCS